MGAYEQGWVAGSLLAAAWMFLVGTFFPDTHWGVYLLTAALFIANGLVAEYLDRRHARS
jgi:hypothetical protein